MAVTQIYCYCNCQRVFQYWWQHFALNAIYMIVLSVFLLFIYAI